MREHSAFFGDGEKAFALTPDLIVELERRTGSGIGAIAKRFFGGEFRHSDLTEVLRLGLVGGGTDPKEAAALVSTYAARLSVTQLYEAALPIIDAAMFGAPQPVTEPAVEDVPDA